MVRAAIIYPLLGQTWFLEYAGKDKLELYVNLLCELGCAAQFLHVLIGKIFGKGRESDSNDGHKEEGEREHATWTSQLTTLMPIYGAVVLIMEGPEVGLANFFAFTTWSIVYRGAGKSMGF